MRIIGIGAAVAAIAAVGLWSMSERVGGEPAHTGPKPTPRPHEIPPTVIGMNVGVPTYYSQEYAFNDLIKNSADFPAGDDGRTITYKLNEGGYPVDIMRSEEHVRLAAQVGRYWRQGTYDCSMPAGWSVSVRFPLGSVRGGGEHFQLTVPKGDPGVPLSLEFHAPRDHADLDRLTCTPAGKPPALLNPVFVQDMKPFRVIRFMDWMQANNAAPQTWAKRPLPTDVSVIRRGVSVEDLVGTANDLDADPWFTLPFDADDDYYRRFATYVRDHMAPGHKAYVELSNEVWNGQFKQSKDAAARGKAAYPREDEQKQTDYYYADRVRAFMDIWTAIFASRPDSLVRVAAVQSAWSQRGDDVLGHKETWRHVDALATAPYWGANLQDMPEQGAARIDKAFAMIPADMERAVKDAVASKAVADKYGVRFMTYEAGPDIVGFTPDAAKDAEAITYDPRLYAIYMDFLRKWQTQVGGLLMLYDSAGASNYSHMAYTGQPLSDAPKMRALVDFSKTLKPARP